MQELTKQSGTWRWGLLCLLFLAPLFFLSYGFANQYAAGLAEVPVMVFGWEKHIPLWPWTIVPYWSIDLFYGLSLLLCWNKFELRQHVLRLLAAQLISISCFLLFPLKFSFERPELQGFFGLWFDVLMGFDKPFNQAPSLHIVLLIILWDFYRRHAPGRWKRVADIWAFLIGLSVLTTWQHHFIDIPTGLLAGALCLWLFPVTAKAPWRNNRLSRTVPKHFKLALYYLSAAMILALAAYFIRSWALWLLYPAASLFMVSNAYALNRPHFFQKQANGRMTAGAWLLFAPYFCFAWLNSRFWTRKHPEDSKIISIEHTEIYLGRIPNASHAQNYAVLFDACAELPVQAGCAYRQFISLDLMPLQAAQLAEAALQFQQLFTALDNSSGQAQKLLIFCALGYSRSSAILAAWLMQQGHAASAAQAVALIQSARPWVVIRAPQMQQLESYQRQLKGPAP